MANFGMQRGPDRQRLSARRLFQEQTDKRDKFTAMLDAVKREAEREGAYSLDTILDELDELLIRFES
ncbi:MAG: hypothetical protein G8345_21490 [Magnetococcales bacterium]|nr:hypothetical protein [Magnetococcales bacterium]